MTVHPKFKGDRGLLKSVNCSNLCEVISKLLICYALLNQFQVCRVKSIIAEGWDACSGAAATWVTAGAVA